MLSSDNKMEFYNLICADICLCALSSATHMTVLHPLVASLMDATIVFSDKINHKTHIYVESLLHFYCFLLYCCFKILGH